MCSMASLHFLHLNQLTRQISQLLLCSLALCDLLDLHQVTSYRRHFTRTEWADEYIQIGCPRTSPSVYSGHAGFLKIVWYFVSHYLAIAHRVLCLIGHITVA